jgi:3-mercaptopyruvate sulfurtransferase SseA
MGETAMSLSHWPALASASALLVFAGAVACVASDRYPHAEYLVEDAALRQINPQSKQVVLDARARRDFDIAHVPGAICVDHALWAKSFSEGKDREAWSRRIGALGIDAMSDVVI